MTQNKSTTPASKKSRRPSTSVARSKDELAESELGSIVDEVRKQHGQESIRLLSSNRSEEVQFTSSGCLSLDRALGIGGYPQGRIVEVYGPESSGKTTLMLHAIAEAQRAGGVAAFIDAEHAFDPQYATAIGVDCRSLLLSQPDNGEQALDIVETLSNSQKVQVIVIDSVAALVPQAEIDGSMADNQLGLQARLMSRALRKLAVVASKSNTTLLFVNQLRHKIGVMFGSPETTPGGNALKFYASVRLDVRRIGKVTVAEQAIGNRTRVKVIKNKCAEPFREAEFDVRWGQGVDACADLLDSAVASGVVQRNGAHYAFEGKALGQGREKARHCIAETETVRRALVEQTLRALWGGVGREERAA